MNYNVTRIRKFFSRPVYLALIAGMLLYSPSKSVAQVPLRWYFATKKNSLGILTDSARRSSSIWASPSAGFDVFSRESGTGKHDTGMIPGVGYGIKWGRANDDPKKEPTVMLALDLFISASESDDDAAHEGKDYFNINAQPVMTVLNWVSIGYGPRFKLGLDGHASKTIGVFTFGIKKSP